MTKSDIIIIGAGPGGYRAAEYAAKNGLTVTLFESQRVGGTCLNAGCIPTKCLAYNADLFLSCKDADIMGIDSLHFEMDFQKAIQRKDNVLDNLRNGIETILSNPLISLVRSHASFTNSKTLIADGEEYSADNIIIATGSNSKHLNIQIDPDAVILDSSDLLSIHSLPKSICIIGAGVIGMEFASILNAFGVEVTIVEFLKECLPMLDSDISKRLRKSLEKRGVIFNLQSSVTKISNDGVSYIDKKGKEGFVFAENVLMAVGRTPNIEGLNLQAINVSLNHGAIPVQIDTFNVVDSSKTVLKGVYAIGDVNGLQMLAHAAEMQAVRVVNDILGKRDDIRFDIMPAAIFTNPEAACVGCSEDKCKELRIDYNCNKAFWRANGKALAMNESDGLLKLMSDKDGLIIGCHAFGAHSSDIIQEVSSLMCRNTTIAQLSDMIHIHPTFSEILKSATL